MSGHSKWANIKRKKGANDAIRGKITTKIGREITIAVRMGGGDPTGNMRLKLALSKAKANNIPKDNIQRAIQKGLGAADGSNYEELVYEGYGPGGSAVMLDILTDNRNRTAADMRHLFSKHGGNMGESGCVGFMFEKKGVITIEPGQTDEDTVMELLLELDVDDIKTEDGAIVINMKPDSFNAVYDAIKAKNWNTSYAEVTYIPQSTVALDEKKAEQCLRLIDAFEDHDDVQNVYSNYEISDEIMQKLQG